LPAEILFSVATLFVFINNLTNGEDSRKRLNHLLPGRSAPQLEMKMTKETSDALLTAIIMTIAHIVISVALACFALTLRIRIVQTGNPDLRWQIIRYALPLLLGGGIGFALWLKTTIIACYKSHCRSTGDEEKAQWNRILRINQVSPVIIVVAVILIRVI